MKRYKREDFDTTLHVNPQQIMPVDRYFFLYPNLKLIDEGVKPKDLPLIRYYGRVDPRKRKWRGNPSAIARTRQITRIYLRLKNTGYKITGKRKPIRVTVEAGGLILCHDGHNRLCMLHHLGTTDPIMVKARLSPEIKELMEIKNKHKKGFYQCIPHPIFQDAPLTREGGDERLKYLTLCLRADTFNSILDIGSYTGYYAIMLAKKFNCKATGIERNPECHKIATGLKDWWHRFYGDVDFINADFMKTKLPVHDVTLCLSVLHHYLKQSPEAVIAFVNKLEESTRKFAIIEVAGDVPQMKSVKPSPTKEVWIKILSQTNFGKVRLLRGSPGTRHFFELRCRGKQ